MSPCPGRDSTGEPEIEMLSKVTLSSTSPTFFTLCIRYGSLALYALAIDFLLEALVSTEEARACGNLGPLVEARECWPA